ncbi:MAG: hypothetical protein U5L72_11240 [Bacteroidales bacterium]|nr:hypothetical protein [Bacteroidales bacterium]
MTRIIRLPALTVMAVLLSCSNNHLIVERSFRNDVLNDYRGRTERYGPVRSDLFGITDTISDVPAREAVSFLLAYMPLSDLAVYEPGYLTEHASAALADKEGDATGSQVFRLTSSLISILPLQSQSIKIPYDFRIIYYDELKERVNGLNAVEAALEINRWCQEKVAYQPSDSRTSSPVATLLSARGRCGGE